MAPSPNCIGVLLLKKKGKKKITPNPAVDSLTIVYTPVGESSSSEDTVLKDPSGLSIRFQSVDDFSNEEKRTR
jgi:hypothetical protein